MKEKKFNKKLNLKKRTVSNLNDADLKNIWGGTGITCWDTHCICNPDTNNSICYRDTGDTDAVLCTTGD